jgi:hypothetical protein
MVRSTRDHSSAWPATVLAPRSSCEAPARTAPPSALSTTLGSSTATSREVPAASGDQDGQLPQAGGTPARHPDPWPGGPGGARRLPEDHLAAAGPGEHQLGAVLAGTVQHQVDGGAAAPAGADRHLLQHLGAGRRVGPLPLGRVAVDHPGPRPRLPGLEDQVPARQRHAHQVRQPRGRVGVARHHEQPRRGTHVVIMPSGS